MRKLLLVALALAALLLAAMSLTPPKLEAASSHSALPTDIAALDGWLAARERAIAARYDLVPNTEKKITWHDGQRKTQRAVIYLHGFSATRQETAPVSAAVAAALGANLFETRLAGHGHSKLPMAGVTAEDWLADAVEALAIGAALGDELIVIGTSTGATLALAMSGHELMQPVSTLVFISPNYAPADPASAWLTRPAGPQLAQLIAGDTRTWTAHNELQERYWSTRYPTRTVVEVMRLVDRANTLAAVPMTQDVLFIASDNDTVVSPAATRDGFDLLRATRKQFITIEESFDPSSHVLAGDILSPQTNDRVIHAIVDFVTAGSR